MYTKRMVMHILCVNIYVKSIDFISWKGHITMIETLLKLQQERTEQESSLSNILESVQNATISDMFMENADEAEVHDIDPDTIPEDPGTTDIVELGKMLGLDMSDIDAIEG